ncbi:MAG: DUF2807 domain-containing protein [Bacteroidales bacterium]|nr:DUF2807 domain-containing protein [Bacteroidales bacterium]
MNSMNFNTETREIKDVKRVLLKDYGHLFISQGEEESLRIEGEPDVLATVKTMIREGELVLDIDTGWFDKTWNAMASAVEGRVLKYHLMVKSLDGIYVQGAATVKMQGLKTESLYLTLKGAGEISLSGLEAGLTDVDLPGAGRVFLEGKTDRLHVSVKGAGSFDAPHLESREAKVALRGVGKASVWVTSQLDATVEGIGAIDYYGNPTVRQNVSGLGIVNARR